MKNAKNDKTMLKRERILTTKRLRLARLIVALCLTTSGSAFWVDEARSQEPTIGYSSVYLSDTSQNTVARANLGSSANLWKGTATSGAGAYSAAQGTSATPVARANLGSAANVGRVSSVPGSSSYSAAQGTTAKPIARANLGANANANAENAYPVRSASAYSNAQGKVVVDSSRVADASRRAFSVPTTIPKSTTPKPRTNASRASSVLLTAPPNRYAQAETRPAVRDEAVQTAPQLPQQPQAAPRQLQNAPQQAQAASQQLQNAPQQAQAASQQPQVAPQQLQTAPRQLREAVASLQGASSDVANLETLETAMQIALEQSRTQRALALQKGAARSTTEAARSLANPKITNSTAYVSLANRPTLQTKVDLSGSLSGLGTAAPEVAEALAGIPLQFNTDSVLADKEFVTTVTAVTIPVYLGGRVMALTRAAEATTAAIEAGEDVGEQTVKSQVSEAYFLVLRTRKLHKVTLEAIRTTQSHLDDAQRMLNVGVVTRNVVLAAQVANAEAKQLELRVANAQNLAEAAYNRILWRPLDAKVEIADVELGAPVGELEELTTQAVRTRAELRVLQNESRAMQEQINVARADVLPQVAVVGAYSYHENEALKENSNGTAAVGMVWTPFDGGTSRARQDAARQNAIAITRAREEAESGIKLQVRQAWLAEQEARERVEVARVAVEQAEENLRVVTRGFQEGLVNHTEALDASTMQTTAKSNFANAQYDAILASQRLKHAVGIL